jgi:hypothetical protein
MNCALISQKFQIQVAIALTGQRHVFDFLPRVYLRFVVSPLANPLPLFKEDFHLQMIKHSFSIYIDATEAGKVLLIAGGNHAVKHDPVTPLAEVVLKFHYQ